MSQAISLFANPGQTISLVVQVIDGYGARADGYVPQVMSIFFPDFTTASGFPKDMTRLSKGLYVHSFQIPSGTDGLGTFIASIKYTNPTDGNAVWQVFVINVALPFGNSSVSPL